MIRHFKEFYLSHKIGSVHSLLPLLFLGIVVYLQQAWVPGFFQDGYLYAAFGKHASELGYWLIPHLNFSTYGEFPDHSPFLFILEGAFFTLVGSGETQARLFGASFSLMSLVFLYLFVEKNTNRKRAFYTTLAFITIYPLIKKTRFPNMDVAIMLTMMLSMFAYYKNQWLKCGLFSGLSLLIKGPIAFLIPLSILIHIIVTKNWSIFKKSRPWIGLLIAFLIFSIWPILLLVNGRFDIFQKYLHSTFTHTISSGRGLDSYQLHTYFLFLLKQTPHLFVLFVLILFRKKDDISKFALTVFLTIFIFLTLQKLKYSHYLIPLYPFYALFIGEYLSGIREKFDFKITFSVKVLAFSLALILLIFPLTTKTRRDLPLFKTNELMSGLKEKPTAWAIIGDSYPFFAAANFFGYYHHHEVYRAHHSMIEAWLGNTNLNTHVIKDFEHPIDNLNWGFLVRSEDVIKWRSKYSNFDDRLVSMISFRNKGMTVLLPKVYFYSDALLKLP